MKKVFSTLILAITLPVKLLKKTRIDNFVGGLFMGALFSLFVNFVTNQYQDKIFRQRVLEAVENEIVSNMVVANTILQENSKKDINSEPLNYYKVSLKYSSDTWSQSSESLQYVAQLNPELQIALHGYYYSTINAVNSWVEKTNKDIEIANNVCFDNYANLKQNNNEECLVLSKKSRGIESLAAKTIYNESFALLQKFHPTKDRLNNRLLRIIMGSESIRILSGK